MSDEHEIESLMDTAMRALRELIDVNTIIGDIIETDSGITVIPISKVNCGFIAGGGDITAFVDTEPFVGGSGAGISLQPVGFLVISPDHVRLIPVYGSTALDKAIEAIPVITEQVKNLFDKKEDKLDDKDCH